MNQLSSMVKTFVEGQGSMMDSLDEMIDRHSQEQVGQENVRPLRCCWTRNAFFCKLQCSVDESIAIQVADYMLLATQFFIARQVAKRGCYTCNFICNLQWLSLALQVVGTIARVTASLHFYHYDTNWAWLAKVVLCSSSIACTENIALHWNNLMFCCSLL